MTEEIRTDVVVVGAGITGLATAHFLTQRGIDTHVLEKEDRVGGTIQSERVEGFLVEYGPNSTLDTSPVLHELFSAVRVEGSLEYANENAKNRYIVRNGRLNSLPMNPLAFVRTPLFSPSSKLRLLREPFMAPSDPHVEETVADFVRRRLGSEFLDYAVNPFVAGVYAGDPEELSLQSSFPRLHELEQEYGSLIKGAIRGVRARRKRQTASKQNARLFSFTNGMETMVTALAEEAAGGAHTSVRIESVARDETGFVLAMRANGGSSSFRCRGLVLAVPTHAYSGLNVGFEFPIRRELERVVYAPVAVVFFGYRSNPARVPVDGFGFLVPKVENRRILGTVWSSSLFPGRAPAGGVALTTFVGGSRQPAMVSLPDGELIDTVREDLRDLMGIETPPETVVIRRWEKAIPQYRLGHRGIIDAIEQFERRCPGLYVAGNFRGGISIGDCITSAKGLSERVASDLPNRTREPTPG